MTIRSTHRLPTTVILAACAAGLLLATMSSQTMARAHKAACKPSSATHLKRGANTCVRSKGKKHACTKAKGRHCHRRHVRRVTGNAPALGTTSGEGPSRAEEEPAGASCANGAEPVTGRDGSLRCADGSKPACEEGLTPLISSNGSTLLCAAAEGNDEEPE